MLEASLPPIDDFPAVLARIPSHIDLEALAREAKAFQRPRGVRSASDLVRLAFAWGPGGYSLQRVAAWAGERKIASLTEDALIQRNRCEPGTAVSVDRSLPALVPASRTP